MPGTMLGRGNILYHYLAAPSLTPSQVGANTTSEQSFTCNGLLAGDFVSVSFNGDQTNGIGIANARVPSNNTIEITFSNSTGGALTPAVGNYYINICRPENLPILTSAV